MSSHEMARFGDSDTLHRTRGHKTWCGLSLSRPSAERVGGPAPRANEMCRNCFTDAEVSQAAERERTLHEATMDAVLGLLEGRP